MNASSLLQIEQSLRSLGFSRQEIQVLIYLFRVKKATVKEISQKTALAQTMVQIAVSNLSRKGLVIGEPGQEDSYIPCSVQTFKQWIKEEQERHLEIYQKAEDDIDVFFEQIEESSWHPKVLYYEGKEGVKEIYDDILKTGQDIYTCTDMTKLIPYFGEAYLDHFIDVRIQKNMHLYTIRSGNVDQELQDLEQQRNKKVGQERDELRKIKIMKGMNLNGELKVYGDKCAIITFEDENPIGFVFQGEAISKLMLALLKSHFEN